jgi:ABC-type oligopeptide transport system ATPase subunit
MFLIQNCGYLLLRLVLFQFFFYNGRMSREDMPEPPLLETRNLSKFFPGGKGGPVKAVDGVSLRVLPREIFGIVGESGSGKSTLARLVLRLIEPDEGRVILRGEDISVMKRRELLNCRRSMQMVFQNPLASFNPKLKIGAALREICVFYKLSVAETDEKLENLIAVIGLRSEVLACRPSELSGGQLQRLAIARSLIGNPALLIADEPVSALDVSIQAQLLNLFADLRERLSLTMIFISHDMSVIEHLCDRVAVMRHGRIMEEGPTREIFQNPQDEYTKCLIAAAPKW